MFSVGHHALVGSGELCDPEDYRTSFYYNGKFKMIPRFSGSARKVEITFNLGYDGEDVMKIQI